ncbi:FAD-dependent oxidoreductase [Streptomyces phyllanthi]|uniref:FAD-dependent oxidoreductase n=1 Tax=Streptomyces phyllanthi TaxID=1803180 RepID=A0A5N8WCC2_9ACTN|nr:alpha/beta fold hydrolase [Streptomyces phyllanthi]MPY43785.1 FAD-dependent oxidoreductase [Streptomyces phyllanthi]
MNARELPGVVLAEGPRDPRMYDVDEDFRRVLIDMSALTVASGIRKDRFFHATSAAVGGRLDVVAGPGVPAHRFFRPGRTFRALARFSNSIGTDDVSPTVRGLTLRLIEDSGSDGDRGSEGGRGSDGDGGGDGDRGGDWTTAPGLLDLTFNTGECFFASTAEIFRRSFGTPRERQEVIGENPRVRSVIWDNIRNAGSYATYDLYSQVPQGFLDDNGRTWLARYRVRPLDEPCDPAPYDHGDALWPPDAPNEIGRPADDPRPPAVMRDGLRAQAADAGIRSVLQIQLHPLTDSAAENEAALDASRPWSGERYPWADLAHLVLDTVLDDDTVNRLRFDPALAPPELGIALARSPHSTASLNHLRALIYQATSYARLGLPTPVELAELLRPVVDRAPSRKPSDTAPATSAEAAPGSAPAAAAVDASATTEPRTVCVLGAGPTGLTTALELERAGHRVIVLEARDSVAGKCETVDVDGLPYDLGGHICTNRYEQTAALAQELGLATEDITPIRVIEAGTSGLVAQNASFFRRDVFQRYTRLRAEQFPRIGEPGLAHSAKALSAPLSAWLAEHDLHAMADSFGTGYTAGGYGHLHDDPPALYFVKYAEMTGLMYGNKLLGHPGAFTITGGFASLWQRIADRLTDLRLGVRVRSIRRSTSGVRIEADGMTVEADDLVLTVPIDQVLPVLDATDAERDLASRIRYQPYDTVLCTAQGLPRSGFFFVESNAQGARAPGRSVAFHHRHPAADVYTCYTYRDEALDEDTLTGLLREDIEELGGRLQDVHLRRGWPFMPSFDSADLASGILDRLEELQGERHTYHAGSLQAYDLVESNVAYARDLVRRHFTPRTAGTGERTAPGGSTPDVRTARSGPITAAELTDWMTDRLAEELRLPAAEIDPHGPLEDLGLDSMAVAAVQAQLSDLLGFGIPQTVFFEQPTLAAVASYLADASAGADADGTRPASATPAVHQLPPHVLPLTPARPFFCVGGLGSSAAYLRHLARALGDTRPCYALQLPGLDGTQDPLDDVEEIARLFVEDVRRIQPHGPYRLGGHSSGGVFAYEMACRLRDMGEQVVQVVLLDSYVSVAGQPVPEDNDMAALGEMLLLRHMWCAAEDTCTCKVDYSRPLEEQGQAVAATLGAPDPDTAEKFLTTVLEVYQGGIRAIAVHTPRPSDIPVTLLKPVGGAGRTTPLRNLLQLDAPLNGWEHVKTGGLTVVPVTGDHVTLLAEPHVRDVAACVRTVLGDGPGFVSHHPGNGTGSLE